MCQTTTGTQTAASPEIVRTARRAGTAAGGGGGTEPVNRPAASPTGPAPLIGDPEFLPQHTFISVPLPGDNGFISNAVNYHNISGLNPRSVGSIEEVLELLADSSRTGTGVLDRIRIVSHFFVPDPGQPDQPGNMGINFLRNGGRGALKRHFDGFAESSTAGLRAMMTFDLTTGGSSRATHLFFTSESSVVLAALRAAGHGALVDQLPMDSLGEVTNADLNELILLSASKWVLQHQSILSEPCLTQQQQAYDILLNAIRGILTAAPASIPATRLDDLQRAIIGLANIAGGQFAMGLTAPFLERHCANVTAGLAAFAGNSFRNKLLAVRPRFDRFTTIDIRGCRAGTDLPYLQSVQRFFGRSATVRPAVTAPDRFQRFNQIAMIEPHGTTPQATAAAINQLHNSGFAPYNGATVRSQFAEWADGFGITAAHVTFWHNTFQDVLEFCKLTWRSSLPLRNVTTERLDALAGAGFNVIFDRLGEIFFVRAQDRPAADQITAVATLLANLNSWTTQLNAAIPNGATATELSTHFNNFKAIYEAIESRMSNPSFHNSPARTVPATQPTSFTAAQANTMRTNLRTFIRNNANSKFAPVNVFLNAADARTQDAPARMRYFLALGLPFHLAHTTATNFDAQRLVILNDPATRLPAIRHWIRAGWRGVSRPAIPADLDFEHGRHSAWVVEGRSQGPSSVSPHATYMQHIIAQPA